MVNRDTRKTPIGLALLCLALAVLHGVAAFQNRTIHAPTPVMYSPPGALARKALAFGDEQFLYRTYAVELQNAGDGGGRVTPIAKYNFDYVVGWLEGVQSLDPRANHHFVLAARYFSFTPDKNNLRRIVDFVADSARGDLRRHWFWLSQAVELAEHRLGDTSHALQLSLQLALVDHPGVPSWIWLYPGLLYEKLGRYEEALAFLVQAAAEKDSRLTAPEKNWLDEVTQRLKSHRP